MGYDFSSPIFYLVPNQRCGISTVACNGKAISVADRDSITPLGADHKQHRIRIKSIDAPEKGSPFGSRSRRSMARMVTGKEVTADCYKIDR